MVGTGRCERPTPRTPSECSTRLSHVPTKEGSLPYYRRGFRARNSLSPPRQFTAIEQHSHTLRQTRLQIVIQCTNRKRQSELPKDPREQTRPRLPRKTSNSRRRKAVL